MKSNLHEVLIIEGGCKKIVGIFVEDVLEEALGYIKKEFPYSEIMVNPSLEINSFRGRDGITQCVIPDALVDEYIFYGSLNKAVELKNQTDGVFAEKRFTFDDIKEILSKVNIEKYSDSELVQIMEMVKDDLEDCSGDFAIIQSAVEKLIRDRG